MKTTVFLVAILVCCAMVAAGPASSRIDERKLLIKHLLAIRKVRTNYNQRTTKRQKLIRNHMAPLINRVQNRIKPTSAKLRAAARRRAYKQMMNY